jgi:hypothetical protein
MKERDIGAFIVGIFLGCLSAYLVFVAASAFAHAGMFIIGGLLFTLVVCLLADQKIVPMGFVPNVVMSLGLTIYFLFLSPYSRRGLDIAYLVLLMFSVSIPLSLLVSVPIHLLRRRFEKEDKVSHVFSRDA